MDINTVIEYLGKTNLFNFIIFVAIFALIFKKIKISKKLDDAANSVAVVISDSVQTKEKSEEHLKEVEEIVANVSEEIKQIVEKSNDNAKLVGEKIIEDANITVENIKQNSEKLVENKSVLLKNDILQRASLASVEVAKKHIINELNNNQDLHHKLIDESINTLEGMDL